MRFVFPYLQIGSGIPRPIIHARIVAGRVDHRTDGILDSGADRVLVPFTVGQRLGIDARSLRRRVTITSATGNAVQCGVESLTLELRHDGKQIAWIGEVAIALGGVSIVHWGFRGFLEFFDANFRGSKRLVTLTPTLALPRTSLP